MPQLRAGIDTLLNIESSRPVLLEVFTDASADEHVYRDYYRDLVTILRHSNKLTKT
jgi:2-succinyl-5-enolpyruvyl-6-hydroxy-3-cyclohexene-1-carboxylate synthase